MHDFCFLGSAAWLLSWTSLWRINISKNVPNHQLLLNTLSKEETLCLLEHGCTFITTPETRGSLFYPVCFLFFFGFVFLAVHLCNSAIFSLLTHTFPPHYFAAVKDVAANCLNTNRVSKQISAGSESLGKYREWQHWLSIWAQLFSSLVGNTQTRERDDRCTHTHTQLSVVWAFREDVWILQCIHDRDEEKKKKRSAQTWHDAEK